MGEEYVRNASVCMYLRLHIDGRIFKKLLTAGYSIERSEEQRNKGGRMIFFTFPILYGFKVLNSGIFIY